MRRFEFLSVSCSASNPSNDGSTSKSNAELERRSNLPLYSEVPVHAEKNIEETANSTVLEFVKSGRKEFCKVARVGKSVTDRCEKIINTGIAHSYGTYVNARDYLHEEKNIIPRFGAITGGLLLGYIISGKKGIIKRSIYSISGAAIAANICYPSEAERYFNEFGQFSKKYTIIGYHFLNGVTKDLGGFELPSFPLQMLNSEVQENTKKDQDTK